MTDYVPPQPDAVVFVFKSHTYTPPQPTVVDFTFGAEEDDGAVAGLRQANFMILLTM